MEKKKLDLIIAVVNDGFSSEVLKYANEIANVSATIIKGRGTTEDGEDEKQSVYSEKETIFIVVQKEYKNKIMENLSNHLGLSSNAQGTIFSLPIDDFAMYSKDEQETLEESATEIKDDDIK